MSMAKFFDGHNKEPRAKHGRKGGRHPAIHSHAAKAPKRKLSVKGSGKRPM
jgi:hypothetical protein